MNKIKPDVSIETKLIKLQKAIAATEKLIFGDLAGMACRTAASPDLSALTLQLVKLTMVFGLDCLELAKILTCKPKFLPAAKPVDDAVRWLLGKNAPDEFKTPAGYVAIRQANESQDIEFFKSLGRTINEWHKRKQPGVGGTLNELRFTLMTWWRPSSEWPGLAYCTLAARCDFLKILERQGIMSFPFNKKISPKNFDLIRKRLCLIPAQTPFISSIKMVRSSLRFF